MSIELMQDHLMHLQGLMASLPMTGGPLLAHDVKLAKRSSTKTSANAANTMPLLGDWKGSGTRAGHLLPTPILSLFSRRGQITHIDPFANPHGNYNGIVTGSSGSGKSVMLNSLALGTLCSNGRVWVIEAPTPPIQCRCSETGKVQARVPAICCRRRSFRCSRAEVRSRTLILLQILMATTTAS